MKAFAQSDPGLERYAIETFQPRDEILSQIAARLREAGLPEIQVGPMDGLHLEVLACAIQARRAVEFGTLGGYSGVCLLRGMGNEGRLYTLEIDPDHAAVAAEAFRLAGVESQAEILTGPAIENAPKLEPHGPFDLVFIDADKENYVTYLNWAAEHLRVGGMVIADNTFAWGQVLEPESATGAELRAFNVEMASGGRFRSTIFPTGEGLTVGIKTR